jgi:hypothetical protein
MWPEPLCRAAQADPGMDSEGWFTVNGWKYLVKWHHSGSYQLYPGKVPHPSVTCHGCQGRLTCAVLRYVYHGGEVMSSVKGLPVCLCSDWLSPGLELSLEHWNTWGCDLDGKCERIVLG